MTRRKKALWLALSAIAVLGVGLGVFVAPWISPPPEPAELIAQRWTQLQRAATASPESAAAPTHLLTALPHLAASGAARGPTQRTGPQRFERVPLDAEAQAAVGELIAWSDGAGGLGGDSCLSPATEGAPPLPVFKLWRLGRLALQAAPGATDPALAAALRLAAQLRQRGGLFHARLGFDLANEAVETAQAHGWPASEAFVRYQPQAQEVLTALARESVCSVRMIERIFAGTPPLEDSAPPRSFWDRKLERFAGSQRELQMAKWFMGRRWALAYPVREDLAAFCQALAEADARARPKSLTLNAMAMDWSPQVDKMRLHLQNYQAFVNRAPVATPAAAPP